METSRYQFHSDNKIVDIQDELLDIKNKLGQFILNLDEKINNSIQQKEYQLIKCKFYRILTVIEGLSRQISELQQELLSIDKKTYANDKIKTLSDHLVFFREECLYLAAINREQNQTILNLKATIQQSEFDQKQSNSALFHLQNQYLKVKQKNEELCANLLDKKFQIKAFNENEEKIKQNEIAKVKNNSPKNGQILHQNEDFRNFKQRHNIDINYLIEQIHENQGIYYKSNKKQPFFQDLPIKDLGSIFYQHIKSGIKQKDQQISYLKQKLLQQITQINKKDELLNLNQNQNKLRFLWSQAVQAWEQYSFQENLAKYEHGDHSNNTDNKKNSENNDQNIAQQNKQEDSTENNLYDLAKSFFTSIVIETLQNQIFCEKSQQKTNYGKIGAKSVFIGDQRKQIKIFDNSNDTNKNSNINFKNILESTEISQSQGPKMTSDHSSIPTHPHTRRRILSHQQEIFQKYSDVDPIKLLGLYKRQKVQALIPLEKALDQSDKSKQNSNIGSVVNKLIDSKASPLGNSIKRTAQISNNTINKLEFPGDSSSEKKLFQTFKPLKNQKKFLDSRRSEPFLNDKKYVSLNLKGF